MTKGTYLILMKLPNCLKLNIGKQGLFKLHAGYYVYVGSAMGPGGLSKRINRHLKKTKKKHWHIGYLRPYTDIVQIWTNDSGKKLEHEFAQQLHKQEHSKMPVPGFGASDCTCKTHLFYFIEKPKLDAFLNRIKQIH